MKPPRQRIVLACLLAGALLLLVHAGRAVNVVQLSLGTIEAAGWSAADVRLQLTPLDERHAAVTLRAGRVLLPGAAGELRELAVSCARARLSTGTVACDAGVLTLDSEVFGRQRAQLAFDYRLDGSDLSAEVRGLQLHGGGLQAAVTLQHDRWQLRVDAQRLALPSLLQQLATAGINAPRLEGEGRLSFEAVVDGAGDAVQTAVADVQLQAPALSDSDGGLAAEDLNATLQASLTQATAGKTGVQATLRISQGALYIDPVYVAVPDAPLQLQAGLDWEAGSGTLQLHTLQYQHPGALQLQATGLFRPTAAVPLQSLQVEIEQAQLPATFTTYLQPWLYDTGYAELDTAGQLQGRLHIEAGRLAQLVLQPQGVSVDDIEGRFALQGVDGQLDWAATAELQRSTLQWQSGRVFDVGLGAASLAFDGNGDTLQLAAPAAIPVLDGLLRVDDFRLEFPAAAPVRWQVNGLLEPVSLPELSVALGWPELGGKLSGVIPNVRYNDGRLVVGGVLLVRAFDGEVTLRNLVLEQPFGLVPRLQVDARATDIDLLMLTQTFSFGRIEGRLDGRIDGLDMVSWRPVSFDAEFATPPDDRSRHRISQKAVDNISSIGGAGVSGAVSRSFLRFFEDFPYDRLGIRCRLANGVCDMGGVAPAQPDGYYLVKGRLVPPRLDVIGYADRVDWHTLLAQISAVIRQPASTVE